MNQLENCNKGKITVYRQRACCFTGHRPEKLPYNNEDDAKCIALKHEIALQIKSLAAIGVNQFFSGMARGVDMWCAEAVLNINAKNNPSEHLKIYGIIPFREQAKKWNDKDRHRYDNIISQLDYCSILSDTYTRDCFHKRDDFLVHTCLHTIAVYDHNLSFSSGTKYTVAQAQRLNRHIIMINPHTLAVSEMNNRTC